MTKLASPVNRMIAAAFLMDLCVAAYGLGVLFIAKQLHAGPWEQGLLVAIGAGAYAVSAPIGGRLSDRIGRRNSLLLAVVLSGLPLLTVPWMTSIWQLAVAQVVSVGAAGFFWAPHQAWLSELTVGGRRALTRNAGLYNIAWSIGLAIGPPMVGWMWAQGANLSFVITALAFFLVGPIFYWVPARVPGGGVVDRTDAYERPHVNADALLVVSRLTLLSTAASEGILRATFPNLGLEMHYSHAAVGGVVASAAVGLAVVFTAARSSHIWQNRKWPLVLSSVAGAVAMVSIYFVHSLPLYAAAFFISGAARAVGFLTTQYYSLHGREKSRGKMAGMLELAVGAGFLFGPLVGGLIAQEVNLHAPYLTAAAIYAISITVSLLWWPRLARKARAAADEQALDSRVDAAETGS